MPAPYKITEVTPTYGETVKIRPGDPDCYEFRRYDLGGRVTVGPNDDPGDVEAWGFAHLKAAVKAEILADREPLPGSHESWKPVIDELAKPETELHPDLMPSAGEPEPSITRASDMVPAADDAGNRTKLVEGHTLAEVGEPDAQVWFFKDKPNVSTLSVDSLRKMTKGKFYLKGKRDKTDRLAVQLFEACNYWLDKKQEGR